jgi:Rrf2 family nitric oxide-sensitive transcriptional repressor
MLMHAALRAPALTTVGEVAHAFDLSPTHLNKVAQTLAEHGFLHTVRGRAGGITLRRSPELINLGDVVRATEPDFQIAPCMTPAGGGCSIHGACDLRNVLARAVDAFLGELDKWTLADMVHERAPMLIAIDRARRPDAGAPRSA